MNGKFIRPDEPAVPIDERGHQFGDGVYEVIRVYNGVPFMLEEHLDRLFRSAAAIRLPFPEGEREPLKGTIAELIQRSGLADLNLYLQITRGIAPRNHVFPDCPVSVSMTANPVREIPAETRASGVSAMLHPDERWANCYIKSLNLLPNVLAKQAAAEQGCFEAILVRDGHVTEGSSSNAFIVKDSTVVTTPLTNRILAGITRIAVRQVAEQLAVPFVERDFTPEELLRADEVFVTSTTAEIVPVVRVDGQAIGGGQPGPVTQALYERFKTLV
jgi:D-alanine transaminase